ncbi:MAG: glycoside hydrolase family 3 protein [Novosphingobium sp.]|nr:glycoside hydrolase family 3 protein [Novosphingobium sp.]
MKRLTLWMMAAAMLASTPVAAQQAGREIYRDPRAALEARVDDLMARLTLDEKIALLAGKSSMAMNEIPRLGIPSIHMTDGPTGVRSPEGTPATIFPVGIAIAATWNPAMAHTVGAAIGREAKAHGADVLLAPTVNIIRSPRWGRNFETYSEDPWLTSRIALGYVGGVQDEGVGVSIKHFAANNQETARFVANSIVDERTLREIYLPAFEAVVRDADPWSVMASYNQINGTHAAENRWLLTDVLKQEWGFRGFVVSDWGATHSTVPSLVNGLDLEMPGPPTFYGDKLKAAVAAGQVTPAQIDEAARRMVRLIVRSGAIERGSVRVPDPQPPHDPATARAAAEEAIVLLKNDRAALPLDDKVRTIAVIGPNADIVRIQGGGSSNVVPFETQTPLQALRTAFPSATIAYQKGVDNDETPPPADPKLFSPSVDSSETGLAASYYASPDGSGAPVRSERATSFFKWISGNVAGPQVTGYASLRWEGVFRPRTSGTYEFSVRGTGTPSLTLDGKLLLEKATKVALDNRDVLGFPVPRRTVSVQLEAGRAYPIRLDYANGNGRYENLSFGVREPRPSLDAAVAAAKAADVAIVVVGSSATTEGEGYDRATLDLPGEQSALVDAIAAANPRTVVVINAGAPVTMPWRDRVAAILDLWLPGEGGAAALADIVAGKVNPSGRLPVTFPARTEDDPVDIRSAKSTYAEGLLIGYRGYLARGVEPLFPFGHGLSYTSFAWSPLQVPKRATPGKPVTVSLQVRNTGAREGKDVVQIYVEPPQTTQGEPPRALRAFAKVALPAGAKRTVKLTLDTRAFSVFDPETHAWRVRPGIYRVVAGASVTDIRSNGTIVVR